MSDKITVDGEDYSVEWNGTDVTLRPGEPWSGESGVGRSSPVFETRAGNGAFAGKTLVDFGDNDNGWSFDSDDEAEHFVCVLDGVMRLHLAAAREAGRRQALAELQATTGPQR